MTETPNYKLKKPDLDDLADIEVLNNNMDIIDGAMDGIKTDLGQAAQEDTLQSVVDKIGNTTDTGATDSTGTVMGKLNALYNKKISLIKSVQRGTLNKFNVTTKDNFGVYSDVTISNVNVSKSFLIVNSSAGSGTNGDQLSNGKIVNSTTIRLYATYETRSSSDRKGDFNNYNWQVIEFN